MPEIQEVVEVEQDELLTTKEAAGLLQFKPETLANWRTTKRYKLPYRKIGSRSVRYKRSDVIAFRDSGVVTE